MKTFLFNKTFVGISIISRFMVLIFTFNRDYAVSFFPFIFYRNRYGRSNIIVRNHEIIHIRQQMECGLVGIVIYVGIGLPTHIWLWSLPILFLYYWIYLFNFIWNLFKYKGNPLVMTKFEREAYNKANLYGYYKLRKPFAWIDY